MGKRMGRRHSSAFVLKGLFVWLLLISAAAAHSWYPTECCRETDCRPIASERVMEFEHEYLIDGRLAIGREHARPSPDGGFHGCPNQSGGLRCFFAPPRVT